MYGVEAPVALAKALSVELGGSKPQLERIWQRQGGERLGGADTGNMDSV